MFEFEGLQYARVSEIISDPSEFAKIPKSVLENKQRIGTNVHEAIKTEIDGDFPILQADEVGYFVSFMEWYGALKPRFIETERRYFDEEKRITGQVDGIVMIKGASLSVPMLIDFKTSTTESPKWVLQAHLYHYLIQKSGLIIAPRMIFLKLDKDGHLPRVIDYLWSSNTHLKCMSLIDQFWSKQPSQK